MQHPHMSSVNGYLLVFAIFAGRIILCNEISKLVNASTISSIMNIPKQELVTSTTVKFQNTTLDLPTTTTKEPILFVNTSPPTSTTQADSLAKPISFASDVIVDPDCPDLITLPNLDKSTQEELTLLLTNPCRYDRLVKPPEEQLEVFFRFDMTHIESADHLQLKAHILVQVRYKDSRLTYKTLSPNRRVIRGEENLKNQIWVPHLILNNEKESSLMGLSDKDIFIQIHPEGEVIYAYRMSTLFYCWMDLKKFPFDRQTCDLTWVSCTSTIHFILKNIKMDDGMLIEQVSTFSRLYEKIDGKYKNSRLKENALLTIANIMKKARAHNVTDLILKWEENTPFTVGKNPHLTEFVIEDKWTETNVIPDRFYQGGGGLSGNYSAIIFKFKMRREVGYYIMDYFLPSILLVCTSWVTFWLQADASPPRVVLGTSTMLTFITLNGGLSKNLPKVSYIKASEIWFLSCTSFIFFSLAEFAFVNVIWRRKKKVEMKTPSSKNILKGALTPSLARKQLRKANSMNSLQKTRSCGSLDREIVEIRNTQQNYLTVHGFPSSPNVPTITHSQDDLLDDDSNVTTVPIPEAHQNNHHHQHHHHLPNITTMTPQEVAMWIDKKSRIVFPLAFLIFNILYWSFVYVL